MLRHFDPTFPGLWKICIVSTPIFEWRRGECRISTPIFVKEKMVKRIVSTPLFSLCSVLSQRAVISIHTRNPTETSNLTRGTNGWSSNLKTAIFNNENVNTYENVVCEMSSLGLGLSAWLVYMIWRRCKYYALCFCMFKIVVLHVY